MTRGQSQKDEDTSSSSSRGAAGKKKEDIRNASPRSKVLGVRAKDSRTTATTSSAETESFTLIRSSMETPTKKVSMPSQLEQLEKQNMSTPLKKRRSESQVQKGPQNPLRRSDRIEKFYASSLGGKAKDSRSMAASSSAETESYILRRSSMETPTKKVSMSSKSEQLEKQNMSAPLQKRRSESKVHKGPQNPLRRSDRIEKLCASSPSEKEKKANDVKNGKKKSILGTTEETKTNKLDSGSTLSAKKTKRMDARTYRALFTPVVKKAKISETLHYCDSRAADSAAALEGGDECTRRKFDEPGESFEQRTKCSELRRVQDMQAKELCSCIAKRSHDSSFAFSEEAHDKIASDKHENAASCLEEYKGNSVSEAKSQLAGAEKPNCSVASACTISVKMSMEENKARSVDCDFMDISKQLVGSNILESFVEIQKDGGPTTCVVCRRPETDLSCDGKGCNRSYHLSCLDPPLQDTPPGVWLCIFCIKRKIEFGVYSVSEGIDSIWNIKEGLQIGKHYLVKYKGLAHVHNQWISEIQMLQEAPTVLSKFSMKYQIERAIRWKQEWTEPHRLLQKRLLMPQKLADEFFSRLGNNFRKCYYEWLVKWKGLGYEDATWEFETSPFLCTCEAMALMKDYEARIEAKAAFVSSNADKALEFRSNRYIKLTRFPDGFPPGLDNDHLISINRLREFWHRNQNTVFLDDQERVIKSILFILSLLSYACRPFLIISPSTSLPLWEAEFNRLAPSINLVVYNASKDVRKMIRTLEFHQECGPIMFQVLLSCPDAIVEDFGTLECIAWEALFVDQCQNSIHLELFKRLSTDFRLLLLSGQLKDNIAEYLNLLSFLDSGIDGNSACTVESDAIDAAGTLALLKEKLSHYVAYDRKPDSSKFLEYWVPVCLSNVQLEQYCATLISNSILLRSFSNFDLVGVLGDILISARKCCDHPYLVDEHLPSSLTRGLPVTEYLDILVNASGKLLVLDKILQTIRNQGLRVLIFFQSFGRAGKFSIGDILDDFLHQRFGADSYEHVKRGIAMSRRLAALKIFNDKATGRFVFLIENHACLPSIKLSSVDAIIIYNSDWNPLNDLRALQRITVKSQHNSLLVFRLYSSFTLEERLLMFAKENMKLDSDIENINPSVCHSLLGWGASNLFHQLEEFHQTDCSENQSQSSYDKMILNDMLEILTKFPCVPTKYSIVIKAQQSGASYSRKIILAGEEGGSWLDKDPHSFWSNLLEGRCPQWRYISEPSHSHRRCGKVRNWDESTLSSEPENDVGKKRLKKAVSSNTVDPISLKSWFQGKREAEGNNKLLSGNPDGSSHISITKGAFVPFQLETEAQFNSQGNAVSQVSLMSEGTKDINRHHEIDWEGRESLRTAQRNLHLILKPELSKLCEILKLPVNVSDVAQVFLDYIMNNHHVSPEPEMILQAFKISLCWRAASFLNQKIDHRESLTLAKKYLNYTCNEEQASNVYSKLRRLKKIFLGQNNIFMRKNEPNTSEPGRSVSGIDLTGEPSCETTPNSAESNLHDIEKGELQESSQSHCAFEQPMFLGQVPVLGTPANLHEDLGSLKDKLLKKRIDLINKVCSRREEDLSLRQQQEIIDFNMHKEKLELNLKKAHEKDLELINDLVMDSADKNDKIRLLKEEFMKKMTGLEKQMDCQYKKLKDMQLFARDKEQQIKNHWIEEAKTGKLMESFDSIPLSDSGFSLEELKLANQDEAHDGLRNRIYDSRESGPFQNKQTGELITVADLVTSGLNSKTSEGPTVYPPEGSGCLPNQIDSLVSQSNVMYVTETESEPRETPLEVPSTLPPSKTVDLTIGTESESLPSEAPVMNSVIIEAESLPSESRESGPLQNKQTGELITVADLVTSGLNSKTSDGLTVFPPEGSGCLPNQIDSLVSQSNVMYVTETESEPRETPLEVPSTLPPSKIVDLTIGTEYLPSETPVMNSVITEAESLPSDSKESGPLQNKQTGELITVADLVTSCLNSKTSEGPTVFPPERSGCLPNQINSLVSQSNVMYVTETEFEPRVTPLEVPSTLPPSKTVDLTIGTESLPSEALVMNPVIIEADDIPINSSTPATVETEKQRGAENSDILCSSFCPLGSIEEGRSMNDGEDASFNTALLQNQADCHTGFQNDGSPCQAPHFSRHERLENSAGLEVQGSGSLQETPNLADFGTVDLTNHNMTVSNSSHDPLPVCTVVPLVSHVQESIAASGTEEELSDQIQHLSHQNDMPMQEPIVLSSELVGQANPHPLVSQFVDHSFLPNSDTRSQRSIIEEPRSTSQPESVHYPLFPLAQLMPTQGLQPEPLKNELTSIRMHQDKITKMHDDRKLRLKYECDQELEKVRRKYDMLLQDAESEFLCSKEVLETIYNKVSMNQVLAEEFRAKFIENKGGTSSSRGHQTLQQLLQSSQPQFIQRSVSASTSTPMPLPATPPPAAAPSSLASVRLQTPMIPSSQTPGSLASVRLQTPLIPYGQAPSSLASVRLQAPPIPYGQVPSSLASVRLQAPPIPYGQVPGSLASVRLQAPLIPSGQAARWTSSVYPSNSARAHLCPMVPPQPNLQIRSETRAPAPHLQRFRANTSMTSHQQPHADVLSATMGQVAPMPTAQPCTDPHFGQSHISNTVSVCQDASPFYSELPMGVGNSIGGVNRSISQFTDLVSSFDSWLATKPTSTAPAFSQPCVEPCGVVDVPPSNSDVVCISDDD
ncbi:unnamed protein product [Musa acuminata var. zebrina]